MPFHHASNGSGGAAGEFDNFSCQDIHCVEIMNYRCITSSDQVGGHAAAHDPNTDKTYFWL